MKAITRLFHIMTLCFKVTCTTTLFKVSHMALLNITETMTCHKGNNVTTCRKIIGQISQYSSNRITFLNHLDDILRGLSPINNIHIFSHDHNGTRTTLVELGALNSIFGSTVCDGDDCVLPLISADGACAHCGDNKQRTRLSSRNRRSIS